MSNYSEQMIKIDQEELELDTLRDLEKQTSDEIIKQRKHERQSIKGQVVLQPGNSSELLNYKVQGVTADISEGGCGTMFPVPVTVGDIYRLTISWAGHDIPMVFARCRNCRIIREDAFSAGFSFFTPIKLESEKAEEAQGDLL